MPAPLPTLRAKLKRRKTQRNKQSRKWRKTGLAGHGRLAKKAAAAVRKLKRLVKRAKLALRIDWNGHTPVGGKNLRKVIRYALANFDVYITSTNGGTHSTTSYHYRNQAVDIGSNSAAEKVRCQKALLKKFGPGMFAELFGPDNGAWVKDGSQYTARDGDALETQHDDHIHAAVTS